MGIFVRVDFVTRGVEDQETNAHYLVDCYFDEIPDPVALERSLGAITGVVATGLFLGLATRAIVGSREGVKILACGDM